MTELADPGSPRPESSLVSVDVLALRWPLDAPAPTLGLTLRDIPPHQGEWALPGVLLGLGERLSAAATRAVGKLGVSTVPATGQLLTFDEPSRDPRGPTLSISQWAVVHDPGTARWVLPSDLPALAFDHTRIVADALPVLADKLWHDVALTRALLGERFTLARAAAAVTALTGERPDPANLNRQLRKDARLRRDDDADRAPTRGRPAAWWTWL